MSVKLFDVMLLVENGRHVAVAGFLSTVVNRILEKQIIKMESFEIIEKKKFDSLKAIL
jgi:hypothetical protein